jgi:hypothetical protein
MIRFIRTSIKGGKMKKIEFKVQGSEPEPYTVTFINDGNVINALCTCQAGQNGMHCKHRVKILSGISEKIVSKNKKDIETVLSWLPCTRIESAVKAFKTAEKNFEEAKKALSITKNELTKIFYARTDLPFKVE